MLWMVITVAVLGVAWIWFKVIPDLAAEFDFRFRLVLVKEYLAANPQQPNESDAEQIHRAQWHSLKSIGLPPFSMLHRRLAQGPVILSTPELVERYIRENELLPDGKPDEQLINGQAYAIRISEARPETRRCCLPVHPADTPQQIQDTGVRALASRQSSLISSSFTSTVGAAICVQGFTDVSLELLFPNFFHHRNRD